MFRAVQSMSLSVTWEEIFCRTLRAMIGTLQSLVCVVHNTEGRTRLALLCAYQQPSQGLQSLAGYFAHSATANGPSLLRLRILVTVSTRDLGSTTICHTQGSAITAQYHVAYIMLGEIRE